MEDWESRLNKFIETTDREILQNAGKVTAENTELFKTDYLKVILIKCSKTNFLQI